MSMSADDHGRVILSAIYPDRRDLLDLALRHLEPEHFVDPTLRTLFTLTQRYVETTRSLLPRNVLQDVLERKGRDAGTVALSLEVYDAVVAQPASEADFRWSLEQIRELAAERETEKALTESMEILRRGGRDAHGKEIKGHKDARTHLLGQFAQTNTLSVQRVDVQLFAHRPLLPYAIFQGHILQLQTQLGYDAISLQFNVRPQVLQVAMSLGGMSRMGLEVHVGRSEQSQPGIQFLLQSSSTGLTYPKLANKGR